MKARSIAGTVLGVALGAVALVACATAVDDTAAQSAPVVYGADDRVDVYAAPAPLAKIAKSSVVSLIETAYVDLGNPADVKLRSQVGTLQQWRGVCADERFADQPAGASCSGTLIDDDLVLTAGHCMRNADECKAYYTVFGYTMADATKLAPITREQVFACRKLVARLVADNGPGPDGAGGQRLDYAIYQLDRPATPRFTPLAVDTSVPVTTGTPLTVIGSGSGLPLKVDSGGSVTRASGNRSFTATLDTFAGNSGSGVLVKNRVAGILVVGDQDYVKDPVAGCYRVNRLATNQVDKFEGVTYAGRAIGELCAPEGAAWPSGRLCGPPAQCGDGKCTGSETPTSCAKDCVSACGDGTCDVGEEGSCQKDCPDRRITVDPPSGWTCPVGFYATRDGCHCECGAHDPDCDDWPIGLPPRNCGGVESPFCSTRTAKCVSASAWTCAPRFYEDGQCDCDCGIPDPDCEPNRCDGKQATCSVEPGARSGAAGPLVAVALLMLGALVRRRS